MIYLIVGKSCSGKTSAREYLESKGVKSFEASKYIKSYMKKYNMAPEELFGKFGKDFVSKLIFKEIKKLKRKASIVISGLRTPEEIIFFKNNSETKIVGIKASDNICFQRNLERKREDILIKFEEFIKKRIKFNSKIGLTEVFQNYVDVWIENENTFEELKMKLNEILDKENGNN